LGFIYTSSAAAGSLDILLRSDFAVMLALGLRLLPVATVALMRSVGSLSSSWLDAAALHGVPGPLFFRRVALPLVLPGMGAAMLLVAVLSAADITTTLLLEPPGRQTLPVAIFTIMANSPEGLVASVCLAYVLLVLALLVGGVCAYRWRERNPR
jgi:iron(III) transport system permease protein